MLAGFVDVLELKVDWKPSGALAPQGEGDIENLDPLEVLAGQVGVLTRRQD